MSWFLQLFPALTRRRTLAHQLNLVMEAGGQEGIAGLDPTHSAALIESLAGRVATVSVDLSSFRESYYFREVEQRSSVAATVAYAQDLASEAKLSENTELSSPDECFTRPKRTWQQSSAASSVTPAIRPRQCLTVTHCTTGTVRNVLGPGTNHPENAFPALSRTCSVDDGGTALSWCRGSG